MSAFAFLPHAAGQRQAEIVYGEVAQHQPLPASFTDPLYVVIPDWDPDEFFKIAGSAWPQDHGATLPSHGSPCLLVFDSRGTLWLDRWNP